MIKLYDSLTKKKRALRPLKSGKVTMYNCGPTVYDYVHIGNLRAFLFADILRRFLEFRGLEVVQVMNITDVGHMLSDADEGEDKVQLAAEAVGKTPAEVVDFFTTAFLRDIDRLGIRRATFNPRASAHVPEMITLVERMLENRCAYKVTTPDGGTNVYFDVAAFPEYGKLSGNKIKNLNLGARIEVRDEKRHPADFALWIHNPKHLMQWEAPWGKGYPGWHLECSAMAMKYLGDSIDIHTGGEDNKFPHHECEIAQSECATGEQFASHWLHVTHLMVEGKKMSKSLGNFYTLEDLVSKGYDIRAVRYLLLSTHYRQPLNFTLTGLDGAKASLARIDNFADALTEYTSADQGKADKKDKTALANFGAALDDDLNVAEALAVMFEHLHDTNEKMTQRSLTMKEKQGAEDFLRAVSSVLGFTFGRTASETEVPASVLELVAKREEARRERRFSEADSLREEILRKGFLLEDAADGTKIKRG